MNKYLYSAITYLINYPKTNHMAKNKYTVVVGNVGTMEYTNKKLALKCYNTYVALSNSDATRAAGEPVTLFKEGEIIAEHTPDPHGLF